MAKVSFTKLGLKKNQEINTIIWNEQIIEVKKYLPAQEKLDLVAKVLNYSEDQTKQFFNPLKLFISLQIEMVKNYTNISFTEKQLEDIPKIYDLLKGNGLLDLILSEIQEDYQELNTMLKKTVKAFSDYNTSLLGILEIISEDYSNINFDLENITNKLTDKEAISTLKELADLSGFYTTK